MTHAISASASDVAKADQTSPSPTPKTEQSPQVRIGDGLTPWANSPKVRLGDGLMPWAKAPKVRLGDGLMPW